MIFLLFFLLLVLASLSTEDRTSVLPSEASKERRKDTTAYEDESHQASRYNK
jgi:hypothetical protein